MGLSIFLLFHVNCEEIDWYTIMMCVCYLRSQTYQIACESMQTHNDDKTIVPVQVHLFMVELLGGLHGIFIIGWWWISDQR